MSAHTPGPWFEGRILGHGSPCIVGDGDSVVCTFGSRTFHEADARLIAAAPELLAACKEAMAELEDCCAVPSDDWDFYAKLRAAIAKAEGRE